MNHKEYWADWYIKNKDSHISRNKRILQNKIEWFNEYRKTLSCEFCGLDHPACLDFHHREGTQKRKGVSVLVHSGTWSIDTVKAEIDKCEVLCAIAIESNTGMKVVVQPQCC